MHVFAIVAGVVLILGGLLDVFQTLFHPASRGALSDFVTAGVWRAARTSRRVALLMIAGPVSLIVMIALWVALLVVGFALLYWPHFAGTIAFAPGIDPAQHRGFLDALNLSLGALITLGGDMNALTHWLRFLLGLEAVLGFGLLTASLSGLLSIYRALERRNSLAMQVALLHQAEVATGQRVSDLCEEVLFDLLIGLAGELSSIRTDLEQFPVTYYFRARDSASSLPTVLPYVARLATEAGRPGRPPASIIAGKALAGVLDTYLKVLRDHYLRKAAADRESILREYADDQMRETIDLTLADHDRDLAA